MTNKLVDFGKNCNRRCYLCLLFLLFLFKLLRVIIVGLFAPYTGCSSSFVHFFDGLTNPFRSSCFEECIAALTGFCSNCNSGFAFRAIFHNRPALHHFYVGIQNSIFLFLSSTQKHQQQ